MHKRVLHSFDVTGRPQGLTLVFRYLPSNASLLCSLIFKTYFLVSPKSTNFTVFLSLTSSKISPNTFLLFLYFLLMGGKNIQTKKKNKPNQNQSTNHHHQKMFHSCFVWNRSCTQTSPPEVMHRTWQSTTHTDVKAL